MIKSISTKSLLLVLMLIYALGLLNAGMPLDRISMGLKGPVKHRVSIDPEGNKTHHYFDRDGNLSRYWFEGNAYYGNQKQPLDIQRVEDEQGRLTKVYARPSQGSPMLVLEQFYLRDLILSGMVEYNVLDNLETSIHHLLSSCDSLGRPALLEEYSADGYLEGSIEHSYNEVGQVAESIFITGVPPEGFITSVSYTYDADGRLVGELVMSSDWCMKFVYEYNATGLLHRKVELDESDGSRITYQLHQYDAQQRLIEVTAFIDGNEWTESLCAYDDWGNLISEYRDPSEVVYEYDYYQD